MSVQDMLDDNQRSTSAWQATWYAPDKPLPSREQMADRLFSQSCQELAKIRDMLPGAFARYQKALDAQAEHGRDSKFPGMGPLLTEAWREWQVKAQVERERRA